MRRHRHTARLGLSGRGGHGMIEGLLQRCRILPQRLGLASKQRCSPKPSMYPNRPHAGMAPPPQMGARYTGAVPARFVANREDAVF